MVELRGEVFTSLKVIHTSRLPTDSTIIWTLKSEKMGLETDRCSGWSSSHNEWSRYLYFPMSLQRFVLSTSRPAKLCFPKNPFQFLFSFMSGLLILFVCFSIDSCDIYRCYSRSPRSFPTGGILKTNTPYLCLFLHVCSGYGILVYLVPRISWSILSVAVWPSVCDCCRL